jgi:hypothetical protein
MPGENRTSAAKAGNHFGFCGTAEAVPLRKNQSQRMSSAEADTRSFFLQSKNKNGLRFRSPFCCESSLARTFSPRADDSSYYTLVPIR